MRGVAANTAGATARAQAPGSPRGGKARGSHPQSPATSTARVAPRTKPARGSTQLRPGASVEGTVSANRAGYGFLRVEGVKDSVFLSPPEMRGVMHGDRLRVQLTRDSSDRW